MVGLEQFGLLEKDKRDGSEKTIDVDTFYDIYIGDCEYVMKRMYEEGRKVDLIVTSPPYFVMRGVMEYNSYKAYLDKMRRIFENAKKILRNGRVIAVNVGDYLVNGKRLFIGADFIHLLQDIGYNVFDDIIWVKPVGYMNDAGRRAGMFIKTRLPMYYKPNNRYEHIILAINGNNMYRTNESYYGKDVYEASKVDDRTFSILKPYMSDIWEIRPKTNSWHPAPFPEEIPRNLILLYSFVGEVVLDPFFGSGTTMKVARKLHRSSIGIELNEEYVKRFKKEFGYVKVIK